MAVPLETGSIIRGKYRVESVLGVGGMGVVVAASHLALDQRVAIKFLLPEMRADPVIVERFATEARAASRIGSDHVARVLDVDALDDGTPFMVMEYLEGRDLARVLEAGGALPAAVAVGYLLEACEAIAEAHRMGIIHRDIKPANLFLATKSDGRTRVKVLDFGISKLDGPRGRAEVNMTKAATAMGSAEYMAPEQMLSARDVDSRADIWALGVTLYELLTAHPPFPGETLHQVCALVMSSEPKAPSEVLPDLPPGLSDVVLRCLKKDRANRYGSVPELVAALAPFAGAAPAAVAPSSPAAAAPAAVALSSPSSAAQGAVAPSSPAAAAAAALARSSSAAAAPVALAPSNPSVAAPVAPAPSPSVPPVAVPVVAAPAMPAAAAEEPVSPAYPATQPKAARTTGGTSASATVSAPAPSRRPLVAAGVAAVVALAVVGLVAFRHQAPSPSSSPGASVDPAPAPPPMTAAPPPPVVESPLPPAPSVSAAPPAVDTGRVLSPDDLPEVSPTATARAASGPARATSPSALRPGPAVSPKVPAALKAMKPRID